MFLLPAAVAALLVCLFTAPRVAPAADLDFARVLDAALARSHDLTLARMDVEYKEETVSEVVYDFLPTVSLSGTNEYIKDLSGDGVTTAVGDSVLTASTSYQNSYSTNLRWRLIDFGATFKKYEAAALDAESSKAGLGKAELDLKVQVLHLYRDALSAAREVEARQEMLPLLQEAAAIQDRLYAAGRVGRVPVVESGLRASRTARELRELSLNLSSALKKLTLYTGEEYPESGATLADLTPGSGAADLAWDAARHPEMRQYALAIQSKEAQREMVVRSMFPTLDAYYQYNYYGADPKSYAAARDEVTERSYRVGVTVAVPISEDLRKLHTLRRAELEAARLREQRDKKLEELTQSYLDLKARYAYYQEDVHMRSAMLEDVEAELGMLTRLLEGQAADRASYLDQKVALLAQKLDLEKGLVASAAAQMELEFLAEATR